MAVEAGWYQADGDPAGTVRYWDGTQWQGEPVPRPTQYQGDDSVPLASPMRRIAAYLIDLMVVALLLSVLLFPVMSELTATVEQYQTELSELLAEPGANAQSPEVSTLNFRLRVEVEKIIEDKFPTYANLAFYAGIFVAQTAFIALRGATPGKLLLGMRIADRRSSVTPLSWQQAAARSANRVIPVITPVLTAVAPILATLLGLIVMGAAFASLFMLLLGKEHRTVMDRIANTVVIKHVPDRTVDTTPGSVYQ